MFLAAKLYIHFFFILTQQGEKNHPLNYFPILSFEQQGDQNHPLYYFSISFSFKHNKVKKTTH